MVQKITSVANHVLIYIPSLLYSSNNIVKTRQAGPSQLHQQYVNVHCRSMPMDDELYSRPLPAAAIHAHVQQDPHRLVQVHVLACLLYPEPR